MAGGDHFEKKKKIELLSIVFFLTHKSADVMTSYATNYRIYTVQLTFYISWKKNHHEKIESWTDFGWVRAHAYLPL